MFSIAARHSLVKIPDEAGFNRRREAIPGEQCFGGCAAGKAFAISPAARLCCWAVIRFPARQRRSGKGETCGVREDLRSGAASVSAGRDSFGQDSRRPVRTCIEPRIFGNHWEKQKNPAIAGRTKWCGRWDLNPYVIQHTPLKRACLPIPALPHMQFAASHMQRIYYIQKQTLCQDLYEKIFFAA